MFKELLYSSLICFEINFFKSIKSFAPKFFANSSSTLTSLDFFTAVILHSKIAFLPVSSFSGKFSGKFTSTFIISSFFALINCLSKPLMNKSFPSSSCVFFPSLPLNFFPSTVAL